MKLILLSTPEFFVEEDTIINALLEELQTRRTGMDYVFLSPIFQSISRPERKPGFTAAELHTASRAGLIDRKVMAAGGINSTTLTLLQDYGFGGAVILGDLWHRFNIHSGLDYKEVIAHFRKLRKAAG